MMEEGARTGGGSAASNASSGRDEREKKGPGRQAREMDRAKDARRRLLEAEEGEDQEEDVSMGEGLGPEGGSKTLKDSKEGRRRGNEARTRGRREVTVLNYPYFRIHN